MGGRHGGPSRGPGRVRREKPKEIRVGMAYRMALPFLAGPSDQIAVVVAIKRLDARRSQVEVEWLLPGPPWCTFSLAEFPRRVWRTEGAAIN